MNQHQQQEPPHELPLPSWSTPLSPEAQAPPVVSPPPRPRLPWMPSRTVEGVWESVQIRDPNCIPALIQTMGNRDPEVAAAAATGLREFGEAGFQALLRTATGCRGQQQARAVRELGYCGDPRATSVLLHVVEQGEREQQSRANGLIVLGILGILCLPVFAPLALVYFLVSRNRNPFLQEQVAEALGHIGDLRAVGWLAQMANKTSVSLAYTASEALNKILPRFDSLPEGQTESLSSDTIPALIQLLSHRDLRLVHRALRALRKVGDGRALPAVERLAAWPLDPVLFTPRNALIEEARQLAYILRERKAQEEQRWILLRGAAAPTAAPQELLRPAHGHTDAEVAPNELLRPSSATET